MSERPTVLVVEDSAIMQMVAKKHLEQYDVDIRIVNNGVEAVKAVEESDFALILMDVSMPKMSGLEATNYIRNYTKCKAPIVGVTASENREACMAVGMDDFVVKPADYGLIMERWLPEAEKKA